MALYDEWWYVAQGKRSACTCGGRLGCLGDEMALYIHQDGFGSTGVCFLFFRRSARCWLVLREDEY